MRLDVVVRLLDAYFRVPEVENDAAWGEMYDTFLEAPYWREHADPGWERRWNGLMVRGADDVDGAVTCVFPSDEIVAGLEPRTLLFSEHPIALGDGDLFTPLAEQSFAAMHDRSVAFYHVHAPLDHHPEISPSRLIANGLGIEELEEYFPIADGIPGGAAVIGSSRLGLDELAARLSELLGDEIPVAVMTRPRERAGRVAVAGGGGAQRDILEASLERGCETYVTGNAASPCPIPEVQEGIRAFRELSKEEGVAVVDGTHYGTEKLPQLAMVEWFRAVGLPAEFAPGRPERGPWSKEPSLDG